MPSPSEEKTRSVDDFAELLEMLDREGFEFVVIGGCAVGAYAHLRGESITTRDLDLLASQAQLDAILDWAPRHGLKVVKHPRPRSIPTALLEWRGEEINILTYSHRLPPADEAIRAARVFALSSRRNQEVLIADCYHLLENKLEVNRPKDQPHIQVLLRFIEEEVVHAFEAEESQRARLDPARRLLRVTKARFLPERLAARLVPLARTPPDLRFLADSAPPGECAAAVLEKARAIPDLGEEIAGIIKMRPGPRV